MPEISFQFKAVNEQSELKLGKVPELNLNSERIFVKDWFGAAIQFSRSLIRIATISLYVVGGGMVVIKFASPELHGTRLSADFSIIIFNSIAIIVPNCGRVTWINQVKVIYLSTK